jgi:preprotein translocase subunit SecG
MTLLFVALILLASFILGVIVLIQNPKGGGLAGTFGGIGTQFMGVKQTNDVLERGTWIFSGIIALLCLLSTFFIPFTDTVSQTDNTDKLKGTSVPANQQGAQQLPNTFNLGDSNK